MSAPPNALQEKGRAGFVSLPCIDRRETPSPYACARIKQFSAGFVFLCVCLLLF